MQFIEVFFRVLRIGRSERRLTFLFITGAAGVAAAQILEPVLFGRVIDALTKQVGFGRYVGLWVGLGSCNAAISIFLSVATDRYAHRQRLRAMEQAFERTISLPYRYHSLQGSGKVVRTIQMGADQVFHITLSFFRENLIAIGSVVILVPMAFSIDPRLASALFALAFVYTTCNWIVIRRTHTRQAQVELKHQALAARLVDVMGNVTIVRGFTRVVRETELFHELACGILKAQYPVLTWWGVINVITRISSMIAMVTIVAIGSELVHSGRASAGQIVTFVGFSTLLIARLDQLSSFVNRIVGQMPTAKNLFDLIDQAGPEEHLRARFRTGAPRGRVVFENVSFQYGRCGEKAQGVFDLDFEVEPGQTIALVGPTGSGKSTCLSLLQRLYSPDSGRILIDDQDIGGLEVEALCGAIATVFQDPGLFNRSIYENILIGRPSATREEVEEAARRADAHDFILARPGGYDFVVGERGLALSGGERQRVAIARAILKDAPILVLDEATSALDNETERKVQAAMDRLSEGKTTFVIAHRLSTIVSADHILVMAGGRITQSGSFAQLRRAKGLFARLLEAGELGEEQLAPRPSDYATIACS
ncbi:MAG: ATP-binding cassette domain-containing protein [Oligoflexia bacterium]|nr:ATP-binding cassette domain-containing protein [Oligoflexia bacterium]